MFSWRLSFRLRPVHRRHHPAEPHQRPAYRQLVHGGHFRRIRAGGFSGTRPPLRINQHRILPRPERAGPRVRVQRNQTRQDPEDVREELLLLPLKRDILDTEERVHGLGEAHSEPLERQGRDARRPQRRAHGGAFDTDRVSAHHERRQDVFSALPAPRRRAGFSHGEYTELLLGI